jgi:hypothetical protein
MKDKKVLILGNKHYYNFKLNDIIDSFDVIYRFNLTFPGKNNGTKFGKLAMCGHVYDRFVKNPISKEQIIQKYKHDYDISYLSEWYDFFQENKENFDEIFHQNEHNWQSLNRTLEEYGSPHRFSYMASTGYSVIFRNLADSNNKVYVSGFTLCDDELRESAGDANGIAIERSQYNPPKSHHSCSEESRILAWLHNNKKVDASLCMLEDTDELNLKINEYNTEPSEFILNLLNRKIV